MMAWGTAHTSLVSGGGYLAMVDDVGAPVGFAACSVVYSATHGCYDGLGHGTHVSGLYLQGSYLLCSVVTPKCTCCDVKRAGHDAWRDSLLRTTHAEVWYKKAGLYLRMLHAITPTWCVLHFAGATHVTCNHFGLRPPRCLHCADVAAAHCAACAPPSSCLSTCWTSHQLLFQANATM